MYVRTIKRQNKDGSTIEYVQLAHNVWNKDKGFAQAQVLYSFGRRQQLDIDAIKRLVNSLCRFLDPEDQISAKTIGDDLKFIKARPSGGAYLLRQLWQRLNIDERLQIALKDRSFNVPKTKNRRNRQQLFFR